MSLRAHLVELRKRLTIGAAAIVLASIGGWFLKDFVLKAMIDPLTEAAKAGGHTTNLNFQLLTGAFDVQIQLAITIGIVVSSPVWLYQVWAFIVPGLKRSERRYVYGFIGTAIPLFLVGCAAGWWVMPHLVQLLTSFAPQQTTSLINGDDYVTFITKLVVAVGIGFVMPVFLVLLNFIGIVSAKAILNGWRVAVLVIFLFTAIVTPAADVVSMIVLAVPIIILYFGAVLVSTLHDRGIARRAAQFDAEIAY